MNQLNFRKDESETRGKIIYDILKDTPPGTLLTYSQLHTMTGFDFQSAFRSSMLKAANRYLLKHGKKMLINIKNIGYKMGLPDEHMQHGMNRKTRAKRQINAGVFELTNIDTKNMSADERARLNDIICHQQTLLRHLRTRTMNGISKIQKAASETMSAANEQKENLLMIESFEKQLSELKQKLIK